MRSSKWRVAAVALPVVGAMTAAPVAFAADGGGQDREQVGNMIFVHPDGADASIYEAARIYWEGPDGTLDWDRLPVSVNYRGHASDALTTSSNGGATTHAFGFKTDMSDSFGTDGGGEEVLAPPAETPRTIDALSGYPGSWLREAGNAGYPTGVVNDGDVAEPGTAAFLTEVTERTDASALEIARQLVQGRPGFDDDDADPVVVMGGGEDLFFPLETPICSPEEIDEALLESEDGGLGLIPPTCVVHRPAGDTLDEDGPSATGGLRTDGLNLAQAAVDEGYTLIRTRTEFDRVVDAIESDEVDPAEVKVLALFASQDIFNAESEESLIDRGLVDESVPADAKETNLVLYGSEPGTPGYRPPTAPEMATVATAVLEAHSEEAELPYATVWEVEGTDNMANSDNAIGTLVEARYADQMIGVARAALGRDDETTVLTAADGNAGGLQVVRYDVDEPLPATTDVDSPAAPVNPGAADLDDDEANDAFVNPLDGRYGQASAPFVAEPDQFGQRLAFGINWTGTGDYTGGVVSRVEGLAADEVQGSLSERFDNVDVYRVAYLTLFGEALAYPEGQVAPTRAEDRGAEDATPGDPAPASRSTLSRSAG